MILANSQKSEAVFRIPLRRRAVADCLFQSQYSKKSKTNPTANKIHKAVEHYQLFYIFSAASPSRHEPFLPVSKLQFP